MESLKEIRQRLRDLRARTGNAVVEMGGVEPPEGEPTDGALYHIDRAVEDLTGHIEAGYNSPADLDGGGDTTDGGGTSEPEPSGADLVETFDYASREEMLSDPRGLYQESSDDGRQHIQLDADGMRYDWPDRTTSDRRCSGYTISRALDLREALGSTVTEIWAEFYVRWEEGFTVEAPDSWNCSSASRLKTFFVNIFGAAGRFGLTMGPNGYRFDLPNDARDEKGTFGQNWNDGRWHRVRVEVILPNSSLATDGGEARWWVDGQLAYEFTGVQTDASSIWGLRLGANMNQGPDQEQSNWYRAVRVWTEDPGR